LKIQTRYTDYPSAYKPLKIFTYSSKFLGKRENYFPIREDILLDAIPDSPNVYGVLQRIIGIGTFLASVLNRNGIVLIVV